MIEKTPSLSEAFKNRASTFLLGPAAAGKSSLLQQRLLQLIISGEPAYSILIIVSEPEHALRIVDFVKGSNVGPFSELRPTTFNGLARRMVTLFWPLIARPAGFSSPHYPPTYLSYDLAQLLMGQVIAPMIDQGAFSGLVLRPQGIISQILDTLNRAALNRLSIDQASERQLSSWAGSTSHRQSLTDAAEAAHQFRSRCLENNLLDLSLTVQVFERQLLNHPEFKRYFSERFRHLLVDNLEEQTPAGQHFIESLMEKANSTTLVFDQGGGYKRFLAADPLGAFQLRERCDQRINIKARSSSGVGLKHLANLVENRLLFTSHPVESASSAVRKVVISPFRGGMISAVVDELSHLLSEGVGPENTVIVAPYLDSGLCFTLDSQLTEKKIPHRFLRRRVVPRNEPRVRAWLTWLALAHPDWGVKLQEYDLAEALTLSVANLDPVRAQLLARHLFTSTPVGFMRVDVLPDQIAERVGTQMLARVDEIHQWLEKNSNERLPVDAFLYKLFHELLGQPRFKPDPDLAGAAICDWLVRTARRLDQSAGPLGLDNTAEIGTALINAVYQGLVSARTPDLGQTPGGEGINVATVYSYLLVGKPTRYQFWLDVGGHWLVGYTQTAA